MSGWLFRCIPGISSLLLIVLLLFAFADVHKACPAWICSSHHGRERAGQHGGRHPFSFGSSTRKDGSHQSAVPRLTFPQKAIIFYIVLAHIDTFLFALRLAVSTLTVQRGIKATLRRRLAQRSSPRLSSSSESSGRSSPNHVHCRDRDPCEEGGNMGEPLTILRQDLHPLSHLSVVSKQEDGPAYEVVHSIILPNYKEDIDNLRTTLTVLASHPRARTQYEICLAMEQNEAGSAEKAAVLISAFEHYFLAMRFTVHPGNLPGELAGKSSNVAFAAKRLFEVHRWNKNRGDVVLTVIDSDTHLLQDYFTEIRRNHYNSLDSYRSLYVCPIVFDRNAHETNVMVRAADIMWGGAGLAGYLPWSTVHIPTSVYSLPLPLAEEVGGWDAGPGAIGEDMHMMLKCFFSSREGLVTVPVFSPASQCNIAADVGPNASKLARNIATMKARYSQALRHMWGSLDFGYSVRRALQTRRPRKAYIPLFHLLWEAHLLPTHFVLMLIASVVYTLTTPQASIHPLLLHTFHACAMLRNVSCLLMQVVFTVYSSYHTLCVEARKRDMVDAGIKETFAERRGFGGGGWLERVVFPIVAIVYSAVPAAQAQVGHFWTDRLVYRVSGKPVSRSEGTLV